jgi:hypothetical protein
VFPATSKTHTSKTQRGIKGWTVRLRGSRLPTAVVRRSRVARRRLPKPGRPRRGLRRETNRSTVGGDRGAAGRGLAADDPTRPWGLLRPRELIIQGASMRSSMSSPAEPATSAGQRGPAREAQRGPGSATASAPDACRPGGRASASRSAVRPGAVDGGGVRSTPAPTWRGACKSMDYGTCSPNQVNRGLEEPTYRCGDHSRSRAGAFKGIQRLRRTVPLAGASVTLVRGLPARSR